VRQLVNAGRPEIRDESAPAGAITQPYLVFASACQFLPDVNCVVAPKEAIACGTRRKKSVGRHKFRRSNCSPSATQLMIDD
jgi:hypothetical protein